MYTGSASVPYQVYIKERGRSISLPSILRLIRVEINIDVGLRFRHEVSWRIIGSYDDFGDSLILERIFCIALSKKDSGSIFFYPEPFFKGVGIVLDNFVR